MAGRHLLARRETSIALGGATVPGEIADGEPLRRIVRPTDPASPLAAVVSMLPALPRNIGRAHSRLMSRRRH
jgi:hypothetical protein